MNIIHILKDGTIVKDITDHIIKQEDCPEVYEIIWRISQKGGTNNGK